MKTEINLRTREFAISREFYWPRLLVALTVIGLVALFVGGSVFIYLYQMRLVVENRNLAREISTLQMRLAPLEALEARISDLEKREQLAAALESERYPWSEQFRMIDHLARENGLRPVALLTAPERGRKVLIRGESRSMRQVALFMQDLATAQGSGTAVHRYMTYPQNDQFAFEIELTIAVDGGDQ